MFFEAGFLEPRAFWWQTFWSKQLINKKFNYFPVYFSKSFSQAVQRSLEKLASKGVITEKINGKQKVYAPKQVRFLTKLNNNNNNNNNNGYYFICVFECTVVNLAMYRQFTNAAWDWIIKKKKTKTKTKQNKPKKKNRKKHQQKRNQNCITSGLSQFLFLQQKM